MTTTTQTLNDGLFESRLTNGGGKLLLSREDSLTNRVDVKNFNLNNNNDSNKNKNLEAQFKAACDAIQSLPKNGKFLFYYFQPEIKKLIFRFLNIIYRKYPE